MIQTTVTVTNLPQNVIPVTKIKRALTNAAQRVSEIVIEEARLHYIKQRQSKDPTSLVVDSMVYSLQDIDNVSVSTIIFCDGTVAPHAKYVEYERKGFEGYYFMRHGAEQGLKEAPRILYNELKKIL